MPLSQKHVDKLKTIWFKQTGELVNNEEAWAMATRLLALCDALLQADAMDNQPSPDQAESEIMISTEPRNSLGQ